MSTFIPARDSHAQELIQRKLPELATLERVLVRLKENVGDLARVQIEATVPYDGVEFPIYSVVIGTEDKTAPCFGIFGGVHGLERIGAEVVVAYLQSLSETLAWDRALRARLENSRLVFMPIVNPIGMFLTQRSNAGGVDLMRNSPIIADSEPPFLLGGQTYSNILPWYRGETSSPEKMETESRALCDLAFREILPSRCSLTLDVHSGFGAVDRLWFPYAKSKTPPPDLIQITAMKRLFDRSYPNHPYQIEPQAKAYTTHGDLWDFLYDEHHAKTKRDRAKRIYIPWTLELGSWIWLKKNPWQLFSSLGAFNPMKPHRLKRILRRHLTLFDFLHRVVMSAEAWTNFDDDTRKKLERRATELWYETDI